MDFDLDGAQKAVRAFLEAAGFDSSELASTPQLVAEAWRDDLIEGYQQNPAEILSETFPVEKPGMVAVTDVEFHSMCPHHLLPYTGTIHVAYIPSDRIVGIGRIPRLINAFAHRLILQEELAASIAEALTDHLDATGAAVRIISQQGCMQHRGTRTKANVITDVWLGTFDTDETKRAELLSAIQTE